MFCSEQVEILGYIIRMLLIIPQDSQRNISKVKYCITISVYIMQKQNQNYFAIYLKVNNFINALLGNFFIDRKYIFFFTWPLSSRDKLKKKKKSQKVNIAIENTGYLAPR